MADQKRNNVVDKLLILYNVYINYVTVKTVINIKCVLNSHGWLSMSLI